MKHISQLKLALVLALCMLSTQFCYALQMDQAQVTKIDGQAQFQKGGSAGWQKLELGLKLSEGDAVKTDENTEVVMELVGAHKTAEIVVRPKSEFIFHKFQHNAETKEDTTMLDVSLGAVLVKAEKLVGNSKFEVKTPTSIVGIRGTTFEVTVS